MDLSEAEIQLLATLHGAESDGEATDRTALEKRGDCYGSYLADWAGAYGSLADKGLIEGTDEGYRLSEAGRPLAEAYYRERPDMYWYHYQRLYPAAHASAAHSRFCERVYGEDLCQEGQSDMAEVADLLGRLDLKAGERVLDLGCGSGVIAEYISDRTGAHVTGLDYAASAIEEARRRTADKSDRLTFLQADMNALELPERSFDAAISIDTLYWVADMAESLAQVIRTLKPGGQIAIFMMEMLEEGDPPENLEVDKTMPARALAKLGLSYEAGDYTASNAAFWRRVRDAAADLRADFAAEGNAFICENWLSEAENDFLPGFEAGTITRYLYHVRL
jgi:ubiquinone/menaquinone biosynthesis C-methylase UbiE